jgi:SET domain-containing protein
MINYLYKKNISYPKSLNLCRKNEFPIDPFIEKDIELKYIDSKLQFGVFAKKPIKKGTLLGEYTGLIGQGFMQNIYAWNYPSKLPTTTYIDASLFGNILRYINDIDFPNLHPLFIYYKHNWKLVLLANTDIAPGDQLSVRYGD